MLELIRSVETTIVLVVSVLISNFVRSILILTRQYSFRLLICEAFRTVVLNIDVCHWYRINSEFCYNSDQSEIDFSLLASRQTQSPQHHPNHTITCSVTGVSTPQQPPHCQPVKSLTSHHTKHSPNFIMSRKYLCFQTQNLWCGLAYVSIYFSECETESYLFSEFKSQPVRVHELFFSSQLESNHNSNSNVRWTRKRCCLYI